MSSVGVRAGRSMDTSKNRWARPLGALLATLAALPTGCTTPEPSPSPPIPPVSLPSLAATASVAAADAVQNAVTAYRGMWDSYLRVLAVPDPDNPELGRYATGEALKTLKAGVGEVKDKGLKGEGKFSLAPRVTEISPANAPLKVGIRDCVNTAQSHIVRASPGPAYSDKPGGRRLCLATVERQGDGTWKVTSFGLHEVGSCT